MSVSRRSWVALSILLTTMLVMQTVLFPSSLSSPAEAASRPPRIRRAASPSVSSAAKPVRGRALRKVSSSRSSVPSRARPRIAPTEKIQSEVSTETSKKGPEKTRCGDGLITDTETCDDGNARAKDGCSDTCTAETGYTCLRQPSICTSFCGDGAVAAPFEKCDDANAAIDDGCTPECTLEPGYVCSGSPSVCTHP